MKKKFFEYFAALAGIVAFVKSIIIVFRIVGAIGSANTVLTYLGLPHGTIELVESWIDFVLLYFMNLIGETVEISEET